MQHIRQKWDLWQEPSCLRGANVWQKVIEPGDDRGAIGPGPLGPPYSVQGLRQLAGWGANYVNISHPGLLAPGAPYRYDTAVEQNLDRLISLADQADLFVVISFRTGPGRTEAAFATNAKLGEHDVWKSAAAQDAWVEMWKAAARRYRNNPTVVGYDLMVEPNANGLLNLYEPEPFFREYGNTLYNWYPLAERIATEIRKIDPKTPILVGGMNWSSVSWLATIPRLKPSGIVYVAHYYEPFVYTHQKPPFVNTYPGSFDANYDGAIDTVDRKFLQMLLQPIAAFKAERKAPVLVNEFGAARWQPGADKFLADVFGIYEELGVSSAIWLWESDFTGVDWDDFNFRHGPDPGSKVDVLGAGLERAIRGGWAANRVRLQQVKHYFRD